MPVVPAELSDYVLDFLHDDCHALQACSLVCRGWVPAARLHLFDSVTLQTVHQCASLSKLLKSAPHLRTYIHGVNIMKIHRQGASALDGKQKVLLNASLASIFSCLEHIRNVCTVLFDAEVSMLASFVPRPSVKEVLVQYCTLPTFQDFVRLLDSYPELDTLSLQGVSWKNRTLAIRPAPHPSKLRKLSIGRDVDSITLVDWMLAESLHTGIEDLSITSMTQYDATSVTPLLQATAPQLKRFDLNWNMPGAKYIFLPPSLVMPPCPALEHLTLHCVISWDSTVPWPSALLSSLHAPSLHTLTLNIRVLGDASALDWSALESALEEPQYGALRNLVISLKLWTGLYLSRWEVEDQIRAALPRLERRGVLKFVA